MVCDFFTSVDDDVSCAGVEGASKTAAKDLGKLLNVLLHKIKKKKKMKKYKVKEHIL